ALARLHTHGTTVDWTTLLPGARRIDLPTYAFQHRHYWLEAKSSMTETTAADPQEEAKENATTTAELIARLAGLTDEEQSALLLDLILAEATTALEQQSVEVELDEESPLFEVGFNSLSAVELRNRLVEVTGLAITPMLLFDYPTPAYIVDFLRERLAAVPA
ncbi:acyl carrier protein, partial [Kitasatospora sp. NPDC059327]|uniref:acyl carrier protein n=1 Tax=Kitasatospora sp. NPDC059327 TaxID=3346803 RepID=UPI0036A09C2D